VKQYNAADENTMEIKEKSMVKVEKSLLPKREIARKSKGMRV
jgi:hypothetical protein